MDFTQPWEFGDGIFILEDRRIYVNKATLAMSSEVFKLMFTADFAEKEMAVIPLPDKKFDDFVVLMQAVHPPHTVLQDTEMENSVECILPLAHEYQMHYVVDECEKYLLTQPPSIHNLILADKFSLPELRHFCIRYIKDIPLQELDEDPDFKLLGSDSRSEVYRYKLELQEGREPSKEVVCDLVMQPPSVKNLILADKYDLPQLYDKCLQHVKDTPLARLKNEAGFRKLKPKMLNEVLSYQIKKHIQFRTRLANIANGSEHRYSQVCSKSQPQRAHWYGENKDCTGCKFPIQVSLYQAVKQEFELP